MQIFHSTVSFTFGWHVSRPGELLGPRYQRNLQFLFLRSGVLTVEHGGEPWVELHGGQGCLLLPGNVELLRYGSGEENSVHYWLEAAPVHFSEDSLRTVQRVTSGMEIPSAVSRLMELGWEAQREGIGGAQDYIDALGRAVFERYFLQAGLKEARRETFPVPVRRARDYILSNFSEECNADALAHAAGVTPQHLSALFKRHLNCTPTQYLWERRVEEGLHLLETTGLTISEIAYQCGFKSPFHFSRLIKNRKGISPTTLRKQKWAVPGNDTSSSKHESWSS